MFGAATSAIAAVAAMEAYRRRAKVEFAPRKEDPTTIKNAPPAAPETSGSTRASGSVHIAGAKPDPLAR